MALGLDHDHDAKPVGSPLATDQGRVAYPEIRWSFSTFRWAGPNSLIRITWNRPSVRCLATASGSTFPSLRVGRASHLHAITGVRSRQERPGRRAVGTRSWTREW